MSDAKNVEPIAIRSVERFDDAEYSSLVESVFRESQRRSALCMTREDAEALEKLSRELPAAKRVRVGAFRAGALVGWTVGRFHNEGTFTIDNSAVLPPYRRRGLYTAMARRLIEAVGDSGAQVIQSLHRADNNPILIAKLKLGFVISGMQFSEEFGLLVRTTLHLNVARRELFLRRIADCGAPSLEFLRAAGP